MMMCSIAISSWCLGLRVAMDDGMLLSSWYQRVWRWSTEEKEQAIRKLQHQLNSNVTQAAIIRLNKLQNSLSWKELVAKPTVTCVVCMASAHGLFLLMVFWITGSGVSLTSAPLSIPLSAFVNGLMWKMYKK